MVFKVAGRASNSVAKVTEGPDVLDFVLVVAVGRRYRVAVQCDLEPSRTGWTAADGMTKVGCT